jgi:hypothetical protein
MIHLYALSAQGRSDLFLRLEIIKRLLVGVSVALTFLYGVMGLLTGDVVVSILSCYLNSHYSVRLIGYSRKEQILDLLPFLGISAFMGAFVWLAGRLPLGGNFGQLAAGVTTGLIVYFFGCWFCRLPAFSEACEIVSSRFPGWKPA